MGNGNGEDGDVKVPKYIVCGDMQKFTIEIEISRELLTSQFKERTPEMTWYQSTFSRLVKYYPFPKENRRWKTWFPLAKRNLAG